jgi:hypothetical protein
VIEWRKIDPMQLEPVFRQDIIALLTPSQWTWYILHGYRSLEEQGKLWAIYQNGGPKAAPAGKSPHNYGLAIDLVPDADPIAGGLQPQWNTTAEAWSWLFAALKAHPRLHSGLSFQDADHVERLGWQRFIHWRTV